MDFQVTVVIDEAQLPELVHKLTDARPVVPIISASVSWLNMLAGLVLAGLAKVVTETMRAGGPSLKVERYRITDDGRRMIEG